MNDVSKTAEHIFIIETEKEKRENENASERERNYSSKTYNGFL